MTTNHALKTLRLLFPQWQGGNNELYSLGARLLAWLAPQNDDPFVEVPVKPYDGTGLKQENEIVAQGVLLQQLKSAKNIINAYEPDQIVVFGGDCLVSQAPFAYLNERYGGDLGVLWIDAHPDVSRKVDIVGLSIAEHLPWDARNLKHMLEQLPILKD